MDDSIPKIGDPIPTPPPSVFELVLSDHVPFVDPAKYNISAEPLNPLDYFVTSGDAVEKTRVLERDLWRLAGELRRRSNERKGKGWKQYEKAIWQAAGKARTLLNELIKARGSAIFLETEWDDHCLLCIPKNPRRL